MHNRSWIILIVLAALLAAAAWSPWLDRAQAEGIVLETFSANWQSIADGCGFNCHGCGVTRLAKQPFGYEVSIEYACGMLPSDSPEYHQTATGFVSFLGTAHGFPNP